MQVGTALRYTVTMTALKRADLTRYPNTFGLVLCGGKSSRMGTDKSLLQYYTKPQRYQVYELLLPFCEKVFISCNELQVNTLEAGYGSIKDDAVFGNIGPLAALLTAFTLYPDKHILLIGCDYPFITTAELERFSIVCADAPAGFYNTEAAVYEPMLAWYPYTTFEKLKNMHEAGRHSLQYFLKENKAEKYYPENKNCITSVDTYADFRKVNHYLKH